MSLSSSRPIAFIPTQNAAAARSFYEQTLGLLFEEDNDFALVFRVGAEPGLMLRIVRVREFVVASHTAFGWWVADLEKEMDELASKGVTFLRYSFMRDQDERGIWRAPDGTYIAWFHDPDGNTLSISQA